MPFGLKELDVAGPSAHNGSRARAASSGFSQGEECWRSRDVTRLIRRLGDALSGVRAWLRRPQQEWNAWLGAPWLSPLATTATFIALVSAGVRFGRWGVIATFWALIALDALIDFAARRGVPPTALFGILSPRSWVILACCGVAAPFLWHYLSEITRSDDPPGPRISPALAFFVGFPRGVTYDLNLYLGVDNCSDPVLVVAVARPRLRRGADLRS